MTTMMPKKTAITVKTVKFLFVFITTSFFLFHIAPMLAEAVPIYVGPGTVEEVTPTQNVDIMGRIAMQYKDKTEQWGIVILNYATILFGAFLTIDIIIFGVKAGLKMAGEGEVNFSAFAGELLVMVILPAAFIFTVMQYHQEWSQKIIDGFLYVANKAERSIDVGSGTFFQAGLIIFDTTISAVEISNPGTWFLLIAAVVILFCYALMALQVLLINCESYIVLNAGVIMLGFGAFSMTRHYAINFIQYTVAVSVKLFVLQLMIGLGYSFVEDFMKTSTDHMDIATVIGGSVVLLGLIRCIPDICSGIISGQHVSTGNALSGAAASVGAGVMALAQSGAAVASLPSTLKNAGAAAMEAGGGNPVRTAGNFLKNLAGAASDAAGITGDGAKNSGVGRFNSKLTERALRNK